MDTRLKKFLDMCDAQARCWVKLREVMERQHGGGGGRKGAKADVDWDGLLERMQAQFEKQVGQMYLGLLALRGDASNG